MSIETVEIVCPSGMSGVIRPLKVSEVDLMLNKKALKDPAFEENLLRRCWVECTNPGPYDFKDNRVDWRKVLVADMTYVIIEIRRASWGDEFEFQMQCPQQWCRENFHYEVDLSKLDTLRLDGENLAIFQAGNRFQFTLPQSGKVVTFKMQTGAEKRLLNRPETRRMAREQIASTMLALRIQDVEGVSQTGLMAYIQNMSVRDERALEDALDAVDCGVETKLEVSCPECEHEFDYDLPLYSGPFLIPQKRRKKKRPMTAETTKGISSAMTNAMTEYGDSDSSVPSSP